MAGTDGTRRCAGCGAAADSLPGSGRPRRYCLSCRPRRIEPKGRKPRVAKFVGDVAVTCAQCGARFTGRRGKQYCGMSCRHEAKRGRRRGYNLKPRKPRARQASCRCCGVTFMAQRNGRSRSGWSEFCGVACYGQHRRNTRPAPPVVVTTHHGHCESCGKHYRKSTTTQRFCQEGCRPSTYTWQPDQRACDVCGDEFTQERRWQRTCSEECAAAAERKHRRIAKSRRRAMIRGREHEAIDPIKVFERDGWRCQLCQRKLRPEDRGTYKPRAPELDHVRSLAEGGTHTWGNVQCACRACNLAKGATSAGQLGLPLAA